jgi:hypothetical protein
MPSYFRSPVRKLVTHILVSLTQNGFGRKALPLDSSFPPLQGATVRRQISPCNSFLPP